MDVAVLPIRQKWKITVMRIDTQLLGAFELKADIETLLDES